MKRVRIRVFDLNYNAASFILPCADAVDDGIAFAIQGAYQAVTMPGAAELDLIEVVHVFSPDPDGGATPLVNDVAVLLFTSDGPFGLRLPLLGPGDIFKPDNVTVDMENEDILWLVDNVVAWGKDRAGNAILACVGGKREGAGGP